SSAMRPSPVYRSSCRRTRRAEACIQDFPFAPSHRRHNAVLCCMQRVKTTRNDVIRMTKAPNILICDDDPVVHQSLALYLDNEEFTHADAYDGQQALQMIDQNRFDLMILDQMMPGLSGMEVCQAIRKKSQLPIIMLTARGEEIDRILGLEMGADDYIVKP